MSLAAGVTPPTGEYRWVYLWGSPIRAMHWIAVLSLLVLVVTGFYIGQPYFMTGGEASSHFLMGWVRFAHFTAAGVLVMTAIVRMYWLFMGNRYERLAALFPVRRRDWVNLGRMVKFYLMIRPEQAPKYLGHNPLQQLSYTLIYAAAAVMVVTGFALYGQANPDGLIYSLTNWIGPLFGGMPVVRFVHHVLTWAFLIFIPIHVYLAIRADHLERTGVISSIISGGRFVPAQHDFVDE
ncbi:MAG TPA: Ni/Fe-hydrogenase, b-type cytochrome subunit [Gemmatimonadales bacterium]|nr:Ni/Fe-hydrogenase, b-type cytochrome subunit [Gemmatimonadales bacterium]